MLLAQEPRDLDQLLHRVVGAFEDARAQKEPLDVVAPIEIERELYDLGRLEAGTCDVARAAVDAILAVVAAAVGQQNLQQRHAATVGRVAVTDAHAVGVAQATWGRRPLRAAARARRVVL